MADYQIKRRAKKTVIAAIGGLVVVVGLITIPYPGPGWLTVFIGLGILSTEFKWAAGVLKFARGKYDAWVDWLARQAWWVKAIVSGLVCLVVIVTIWLLNGYGLMADFFGLDYPWAKSPFFN